MIKIIIIEDQDEVLELMQQIIEMEPSMKVVATFNNGKSAIEEIPKLSADIILVDIGLPDIKGTECIKILKKINPNQNFMVWSIFNDQENVIKALEYGASSYVLKNSSADYIIKSIKELALGHSPMSPEIARILIDKLTHKKDYSKSVIENITARELEVLNMLSQGYLYKEIANEMNISVNTLKTHCYNIYQKLHVSNKTEAINLLFKMKNIS